MMMKNFETKAMVAREEDFRSRSERNRRIEACWIPYLMGFSEL
jgi:hypothetical protein